MNPHHALESENPLENMIADAIDAAEDVADPLAGLAEKTVADPGSPFMPEALEALVALEEGQPRRLRGATVAAQEGRLPGDGARRRHFRGNRRDRPARTDAGR
jgi:hypothetical protein